MSSNNVGIFIYALISEALPICQNITWQGQVENASQQPVKSLESNQESLNAPRSGILKYIVLHIVDITKMTVNGHANGHLADMERVFPESHMALVDADPEVHAIIEDEKRRQW